MQLLAVSVAVTALCAAHRKSIPDIYPFTTCILTAVCVSKTVVELGFESGVLLSLSTENIGI
jgi:hypothetical protein